MSHISLLRSEAFRDIPAAAWRFDNASVMTPQLVKAREYAENWDSFSREGIGLLLFGNVGTDRDSYIKQLMRPDLLILDDLGAERNTSYGKECVFDVVNRRLLSGKPMIITTNITLSAMQKATDLDDRRIYDRILEVCVPILFNGENFRKGNAAENLKKAAELLKSTLS